MTVGNSDIFAHKTRAIRKAVEQAWAPSTWGLYDSVGSLA